MAEQIRTYGGWRRSRGIGLAGLGTGATLSALGGAAAFILIISIRPEALLYLAPLIAVAAALALVRIGGVPAGKLALARWRWWWGFWRGHTRYSAGIVVDHPRAFQLPGVLAPLTLLSAEDGYGGTYGIIWDRRSGLLTATLRVVPASTWLADRPAADAWVASWGNWLASLGRLPAVRWVSVTVESAPEPGSTLASAVGNAIAPGAPQAARAILTQLVGAAPLAAAHTCTRISITFDPKRSATSPKSLTEACGDLGRLLDSLAGALGECGVSVTGRMTAAQIAGTVRAAFDPHSRADVHHLLDQPDADEILCWSDAGPVGATEHTDHYQHDGGISVSWGWHEPPRQTVLSNVLARLTTPGPYIQRITLQYRAMPASAASQALQQEVNAAAFRSQFKRRTGRDETARDAYDSARAAQAAAEEAMGAGVCLVSLYATVTVTNADHLKRATAHIEAAAEASKIRLRRVWGGQSAAFATGLPCGICPAELSTRLSH